MIDSIDQMMDLGR